MAFGSVLFLPGLNAGRSCARLRDGFSCVANPECGWCALYQIHHNVLYALFRDGGRQSPGFGSADGFGRGIGAIAQGREGGMSISLGAA